MNVDFPGPVGRLEGILEEPEVQPRGAAVLCHPHPLHGGTMRNTIVVRAARALRSEGMATLRINFRGVEGSEGVHDGTGAEEGDVAAALEFLTERYGEVPLWAAGYSFGARTVCGLASKDARIERVVLIALPVAVYACECIQDLSQPGLCVFAGADEFGTAAELRDRFEDLPRGLVLEEVPGADHFFRGKTPIVEEIVRSFAHAAWSPVP
ncbi:MAG TPA: hypothetical protein ENJ09_16470 [Planctomycetes bacterium]|nr:hypothetical protein [Planctomycetota bacterium]